MNPGFKSCGGIQARHDAMKWVDDEETFDVFYAAKAEYSSYKAYAVDGEEYSARVITAPDFYCAHWKGDE